MSRTRRTILPDFDWTDEFKKRMIRGLVKIPKRDPHCSFEEIWGQRRKKDRKKLLTRKERRINKDAAKNQ